MHGRRQLVPRGVLLSQVTSETYIYNCQWLLRQDRAHYGDCLGNEEEGVGNGRSVCSESSGLQARNNGGDNGLRLRKEEPILETSSQFRLWIVTHPHDAGILVIRYYQCLVNMSLLLAHTARHSNRAVFR